jgi:hypothetical protein
MGWNAIGWFAGICLSAAGTAVTFLFPTHHEFGYFLLGIAALCFCATVWGSFRLGWPHLRAFHTRIGTAKTMLVVGILGTWIFLSLAAGAAAWSIYQNQGLISIPQKEADAGPLQWYYNLEMEGGPPSGRPVFSLTFLGNNISQKEVLLKSASIVSAKNGKKIDLDVVARDDSGTNAVIPISQINLIPPGAPVRLVAKFGDPDPNAPGKILGLDAKTFLETWSQFYVNAEDDTKAYRVPFNEGSLMSFFPGMVGPHITKK